MYQDGKDTHIEEDDQCFSCSYSQGRKACPLMEALYHKVVFIPRGESFLVKNCDFFKDKHQKTEGKVIQFDQPRGEDNPEL